ncbi:MAG: chemotaxis protein CheD [Alphaproteobacteria bacterium]|nr:chemotaxis protein CheD [Alphaproteobacteria bacterium]
MTDTSSYGGSERREHPDHDAYFNGQFEAEPVYLEPGKTLCGKSDDKMFVATVGSGVVVSIYDDALNVGAAGYVLIPDALIDVFPHFDKADEQMLERAFQPIIDCIGHMKRQGAAKKRLWVRLMGGMSLPGDRQDRGTKNYIFAREYITRKGIPVLNEDMGGPYIRRIHFFPGSGKAVRRMLRRDSDFEEMKIYEDKFQVSLKA